MASKDITFSASQSWGSYVQGRIVLSSTAETATNTSDVTAKIYVRKADHDSTLTIPTEGSWGYTLTVNGTKRSGSVHASVLESWVLLYSGSWNDITHGSDGTKSISVSGSVSGPSETSYSGKTSSGSTTFTLDSIPRASTLTSAGNVTLGNTCNVTWTPKAASFRYKLTFSMGSWSYTTGAIHPNTTGAYTYTGYAISLEAARQIPNSITGTMTVTLYTYSNSAATTQVGSASSKTFTVTVPTSTAPKPKMIIRPVNNLPSAYDGMYVQGRSKIEVTLSADFYYGTTANYYDFVVEGKTYGSGQSYTSHYLTGSGTIGVTGHAVDKRGYAGYVSSTIYVIPYSKPKIKNVSVYRCNSAGTADDAGTYIRISAKREYATMVYNGSQKNHCTIRYRYKASNSSSWSSWTTILAGDNLSTNSVTTGALVGNLSEKLTYTVEVQAIDTVGEIAPAAVLIPTDKVYMHRAGSMNSMGLGKYASKSNLLDVAWDINTDGTLTAKNIADHAFIPASYSINSAPDLSNYMSSVYSAIPDRGRRSVLFNINVGELELSGGVWHIDFMRSDSQYGCVVGYRYASSGGVLMAVASLYDGTWSKWSFK